MRVRKKRKQVAKYRCYSLFSSHFFQSISFLTSTCLLALPQLLCHLPLGLLSTLDNRELLLLPDAPPSSMTPLVCFAEP